MTTKERLHRLVDTLIDRQAEHALASFHGDGYTVLIAAT